MKSIKNPLRNRLEHRGSIEYRAAKVYRGGDCKKIKYLPWLTDAQLFRKNHSRSACRFSVSVMPIEDGNIGIRLCLKLKTL